MTETIIQYLLSALAAVIALTVHEYAHGLSAYALGDPTAKASGRLSLNPFAHLDLFGTICLILFHFGWAKPVPIDPRRFKHPKRGFAITALAGPVSNLLLAFLGAFLYLLTYALLKDVAFESRFLFNVATYTLTFLLLFHVINLGLAVFNLIPVPPLDGSRLLAAFLPNKVYFKLLKYERIIYWVIIGWLFLGSFVSRFLLNIPLIADSAVLSAIANVFSLSGLLSRAVAWLSGAMMDLLSLLPFLQ